MSGLTATVARNTQFFLLWLISGLNTNVMKPGDRCMKLWARVRSLDKYLSKRWQTFYKHKIKWKMYWNTNILDNFFLGAGAFIYYWPLSSLHLFLKPYTSVTSVALSWEPSQPNLYFFSRNLVPLNNSVGVFQSGFYFEKEIIPKSRICTV